MLFRSIESVSRQTLITKFSPYFAQGLGFALRLIRYSLIQATIAGLLLYCSTCEQPVRIEQEAVSKSTQSSTLLPVWYHTGKIAPLDEYRETRANSRKPTPWGMRAQGRRSRSHSLTQHHLCCGAHRFGINPKSSFRESRMLLALVCLI